MTKQLWKLGGMTVALIATCGVLSHLSSTGGLNAASKSPQRVFELRVYHAAPGKLQALHARFRNHTMKLFEKHGMKNVIYFSPQDKPASEDTLTYLLSHASRDAAKASWRAFVSDPEWKKVQSESEKEGKLVSKVESTFYDPTDYSPQQN